MQNETIGSLFELFGTTIVKFIKGLPFLILLFSIFILAVLLIYFSLSLLTFVPDLKQISRAGFGSMGIFYGILLAGLFFIFLIVIVISGQFIAACIASSRGGIGKDFSNFFMLVNSRSLLLIWVLFVYWLLVGIGFILFVIPGIYLAIRMFLVPQIVIYERKGFGESFERSSELMDGSKFMVFLFILIMFVFSFIANFGLITVLESIYGWNPDPEKNELAGRGEAIYKLADSIYVLIFTIFTNLLYLKRRSIGQTE